jgi:DedD protein
LAVVKDEHGRLLQATAPDARLELEGSPPPAEDTLRVAPLPVGDLLSSTQLTRSPKDPLTKLAVKAAGATPRELSEPGRQGGYQLQIASFRSESEADVLVGELRRRGHHAHRETAEIPGRGLWHRVRIGPFKSRLAAQGYKTSLEEQERLTAFLVDPEKIARRKAENAARLMIRETSSKASGSRAP